MNPETKSCQNCKQSFSVESVDFEFYEKIRVPAPTWCPDCRSQRRMTWRNERTLYSRPCSNCAKPLISVISSDKAFPVFCSTCYHSDSWDPKSFGREVDFSRPFLQQFRELQLQVPRQYSLVINNTNSDYTNGAANNKNCYLIFVSDDNEDSSYSYNINNCKDSYDLTNCNNCEKCYESINCIKSNRLFYSSDCRESYNLYFCQDCVNCHDCFGSVGLRNKSYYFFNEELSKEEYFKRLGEIGLGSQKSIATQSEKFTHHHLQYPVKYYHGSQNSHVTGDEVSNSKASKQVFSAKDLEDCVYIVRGNQAKDCYDTYVAVGKSELAYECIGALGANKTLASHLAWYLNDSAYNDACENSNNIFGCVGLRGSSYSILNKQYTKEEYLLLVPRIIQQMNDLPYKDSLGRVYKYGDFFPAELSPYDFNETIALEHFPLLESDALAQGYRWHAGDKKSNVASIMSEQLPDSINEVSDNILKETIACEHAGKCKDQCSSAFRLTKPELTFYKEQGIPLPRLCFNCRHVARLKKRNPLKLWHRSCMKPGCTNEFETSYAPDRSEIVYCESCYQQEVV